MPNIVFMGTPDFAVPSLERLVEAGHAPVAVVTTPDRERGRGRKVSETPVKAAAQRLGIKNIIQPESVKDPEFAEEIRSMSPDVIIVVAFSILPPAVFTTARLGSFNLHGSLLPKYRGAAPVHRAVMAGETTTGVTTFFLKEKVDTGNVILQRSMPIGPDETTGEVMSRMMHMGADVVVETLEQILSGRAVAVQQDDAEASPAPKIFRDGCEVAWDRDTATLHNFIRGLSPFPGAWTRHGDVELKLFRSSMESSPEPDPETPPGTVIDATDALWIATLTGSLRILEIQQQGRRRLDVVDFLRGYPLQPGDRLG